MNISLITSNSVRSNYSDQIRSSMIDFHLIISYKWNRNCLLSIFEINDDEEEYEAIQISNSKVPTIIITNGKDLPKSWTKYNLLFQHIRSSTTFETFEDFLPHLKANLIHATTMRFNNLKNTLKLTNIKEETLQIESYFTRFNNKRNKSYFEKEKKGKKYQQEEKKKKKTKEDTNINQLWSQIQSSSDTNEQNFKSNLTLLNNLTKTSINIIYKKKAQDQATLNLPDQSETYIRDYVLFMNNVLQEGQDKDRLEDSEFLAFGNTFITHPAFKLITSLLSSYVDTQKTNTNDSISIDFEEFKNINLVISSRNDDDDNDDDDNKSMGSMDSKELYPSHEQHLTPTSDEPKQQYSFIQLGLEALSIGTHFWTQSFSPTIISTCPLLISSLSTLTLNSTSPFELSRALSILKYVLIPNTSRPNSIIMLTSQANNIVSKLFIILEESHTRDDTLSTLSLELVLYFYSVFRFDSLLTTKLQSSPAISAIFGELFLSYFNRVSSHSLHLACLEFLKLLWRTSSSPLTNFFYTNDFLLLFDIIVRLIGSLDEDDTIRIHYYNLLALILTNYPSISSTLSSTKVDDLKELIDAIALETADTGPPGSEPIVIDLQKLLQNI